METLLPLFCLSRSLTNVSRCCCAAHKERTHGMESFEHLTTFPFFSFPRVCINNVATRSYKDGVDHPIFIVSFCAGDSEVEQGAKVSTNVSRPYSQPATFFNLKSYKQNKTNKQINKNKFNAILVSPKQSKPRRSKAIRRDIL